MTARLYGPVAIDLDDGPIRVEYGIDPMNGAPTARLVIGDLTQSIAISITTATPDAVAELAAKAGELADWALRQKRFADLPEVA